MSHDENIVRKRAVWLRALNTKLLCVEHGTVQAITAVISEHEGTFQVGLACGCFRDLVYVDARRENVGYGVGWIVTKVEDVVEEAA